MIGKILTRLFALFGMTLTCVACYGVPEADYNPSFAASGRVVDPEGKPIKGIEAKMGSKSTYTDADGHFRLRGDSKTLILEDVDGEENGGEFVAAPIYLKSDEADVGEVVMSRMDNNNQ